MTKTNFFDLISEKPLIIPGVINPLIAIMAEKLNFRAVYVSGAGVANANFGLPDLGLTSLDNVCYVVRNIAEVCKLPVLVDADTGWGGPLNAKQTASRLAQAGAKAMHIEDQVFEKRCGHRAGKKLISISQMCEKVSAAREGAPDDFMVMARTDAIASEGLPAALERLKAYVEAGAQAVFVEAVEKLEDYRVFTENLTVPVLANLTEFGKTPAFSSEDLASVGVAMQLHPLSAFRAMNKAAWSTLSELKASHKIDKTIDLMQTRQELYDLLDYETQEKILD